MLHDFDVLPFAIVGEGNAGVQERVFDVGVGAAVDLVRTAFRREIVDAAVADAAEFRREIGRL